MLSGRTHKNLAAFALLTLQGVFSFSSLFQPGMVSPSLY